MNSVEIRVWMMRSGLKPLDIASQLGISDVAVRRFILGQMYSKKIKKYFLDNGCNPDVLPRGKRESSRQITIELNRRNDG